MRFKLIFLALALLLLPLLGVMAQDDLPELPDLGGREVVIPVENSYPPYNFIDDSGAFVGWDYDTFRDICRLLNCVPVFVEAAWDGMLIAIAAGEFDVAGEGITYTEERDETVDFGQFYYSYDETLLIRDNEDRFSTVEELLALEDFTVGTQLGTTNEITAHEIFGVDRTQSYDPFALAVEALLNGDVDAVVIDRPAAEGYIVTQGGMRTLDESLTGVQNFAFVYPPGSDLIEPFNLAIDYLVATGRWDQIYTRWFAPAELPDLEGRLITIPVENSYPPYNFIDDSGEFVGWDYDTFREICRRLNCQPEFVEAAWDGMLIAIAAGEFDVAGEGITYTEERDETVDFSQFYYSYDETLLIRDDENRFSTVAELLALEDFTVGTQIGTTNEITAHEIFGEDRTQSYDPFALAVEALLNGDVDAVVIDRPAAEGYIVTRGGMRTLEESLTGIQNFAFVYPPGSDLIEPFNLAMDAMIADGTWDDIFRVWFGS
jgi:polar amino acid transport system substrate-binding protein